jgi:uncharacterized integral membrane protein (TIGR00697 family)
MGSYHPHERRLVVRKMIQACLIGLYAAIFVLAPVVSNKVLAIGPWQLLAGIPFMSVAYVLIDLLNENWGPKVARSAVVAGMVARAFAYLVMVPFVLAVPGVRESSGYVDLLTQSFKLFAAAEIGIFLSQYVVDIPLFQWVKSRVGRGFWLRYNVTTHLSAVLTAMFVITVVFIGNPHVSLPNMLLTAAVTRVLLTLVLTPVASLVDWGIKRG